MAQDLVASFITEKNRLEGHVPLRLFAIEYADYAASWIYLAAWNQNIDYFQPGTATAQTYTAAPIEISEMERSNVNETPSLSLTVSGVDRTIVAYLELYDALRGRGVKIVRTFESLLDDSDASVVETYYVDGAAIAAQTAELRLVPRTVFYQIKSPSRSYRRNQCQWEFKTSECGYSGGETTCLKTLASCDGYDNTIRYGGFPGIPKQRVVIA